MFKIEITDVCMTGGMHTPSHANDDFDLGRCHNCLVSNMAARSSLLHSRVQSDHKLS